MLLTPKLAVQTRLLCFWRKSVFGDLAAVPSAVPRVWVSVGGNRKMGTMWEAQTKYCLRRDETGRLHIVLQTQHSVSQTVKLWYLPQNFCLNFRRFVSLSVSHVGCYCHAVQQLVVKVDPPHLKCTQHECKNIQKNSVCSMDHCMIQRWHPSCSYSSTHWITSQLFLWKHFSHSTCFAVHHADKISTKSLQDSLDCFVQTELFF